MTGADLLVDGGYAAWGDHRPGWGALDTAGFRDLACRYGNAGAH
jgi:hypothetical protein